ncbi:serine/threonine-protein kinase [Sphaerospermopsis torques-reginae]|uniref:Serine/threonine protein kinase n=1 Tax=Sphaerospermopsis torques-reginae ITEP-024 TaxID=984208 RepID=A0ABX8WYP1_9CYAN|nr:serine/threonine-protein kinase [Sphaerospermopsis torques-reginae]QYX31577.1 serine/threonine protein kinase [Sphaerospermopsis torques-reginae ITEP-024]
MNNILPIGAILRDRYQILEILSTKTGFGITYKVRDRNHPYQRILVIKQLKKPTPESLKIKHLPKAEQQEKIDQVWANYLRLFRKETQALANLGETYNQTPTIHERFTELGEEFYVQEYIEGNALSAEIKQGQKLSEEQVKSLLIEILEVVEYIQDITNNKSYTVIHRDIKPENIIRRKADHKLVIIDFVLVKEVTVPGTKIGSILGGTRGYIAPEIALGLISFASDIYSIGMIGVFAITGEDPSFTPNLAKNWQTKVNVSAEFTDFLNKMICEDYKDRFQNAQEALTALKTNKPPIPTPQPTPPPTPSIPWKLIKLMMMGISGIMLIIGVVIGVIAILPKSDSQLIADGKGKSGQLTTTDNKELGSGKNIDVYTFKSEKRQYLTVEVVSNNFRPIFTMRNPHFSQTMRSQSIESL